MESSHLFEAVRNNDHDAVQSLVADENNQIALRDSEGRTFLHHAVLSRVDISIFQALLACVDFTVRDIEGQNVLDLLCSRGHLNSEIAAVEIRVRKLLFGEKVEHKAIQHLLLSGWNHWPITIEEAKVKSEETAAILDKLLEHCVRFLSLFSSFFEGSGKVAISGLTNQIKLYRLYKAVQERNAKINF